MKYLYPATFTSDDQDGYLVTFPDLPEAITQGDDMSDARSNAIDALDEAVAAYAMDGKPLPSPSKTDRGQVLISVPLQTVLKYELRLTMKAGAVSNTELAKKIDVSEKEVRRIIDLGHNTSLARLETALLAMGKQPVVKLVAA